MFSDNGAEEIKRSRMSGEQRLIMLNFMREHPVIASNKFSSYVGSKVKRQLLAELTTKLNKCPHGTTKTSKKWLKSWQDWKSDVKSKAMKISQSHNVHTAKLTTLEEDLLTFLECTPSEIQKAESEEPYGAVTKNNVGYTAQCGAVDPLEVCMETLVEVGEGDHVSGAGAAVDSLEMEHNFDLPDSWNFEGSNSEASSRVPVIPKVEQILRCSPAPLASSSGHTQSSLSPSLREKDETFRSFANSDVGEKILKSMQRQENDRKETLQLERERLQIEKDRLQLIREQGERQAATFDRIADCVLAGMNAFQQYLCHLQDNKK